MKKLLVLLSILLITLTGYTQELKGIRLGSVSTSPDIIQTSVAGIDGVIGILTLNNKTVYQLIFIPAEGESTKRVYNSDVDRLQAAVEAKYNIKLNKRMADYGDDYSLYNLDGPVNYIIMVEINEFMSPPNKISFIMTSKSLFEVYNAEEKARAFKDI